MLDGRERYACPFRVAVGIPVRNEEQTLPALLTSLSKQKGASRFVACFMLDGCHDASEALIRAVLRNDVFDTAIMLEPDRGKANAGRARRAAMALALSMVGDGGRVLTTDADSEPAADWIANSLAALDQVDVVAGLVVRNGGEHDPRQSRLEAYYDRLYACRRRIDPVAWEQMPGHHYTSGANLGFRASGYIALGGFAAVPFGEDAALLDDAGRLGLRVRRDPGVVVRTSSRRAGRAPQGLATALCRLDEGGPIMVGDPRRAVWQYRHQRAARLAFPSVINQAQNEQFCQALGLTRDHVLGVARDCPNAEAFAMRIVPAPPGPEALVMLKEAERLLERFIPSLERAA